jgi:hypothetical protein
VAGPLAARCNDVTIIEPSPLSIEASHFLTETQFELTEQVHLHGLFQ